MALQPQALSALLALDSHPSPAVPEVVTVPFTHVYNIREERRAQMLALRKQLQGRTHGNQDQLQQKRILIKDKILKSDAQFNAIKNALLLKQNFAHPVADNGKVKKEFVKNKINIVRPLTAPLSAALKAVQQSRQSVKVSPRTQQHAALNTPLIRTSFNITQQNEANRKAEYAENRRAAAVMILEQQKAISLSVAPRAVPQGQSRFRAAVAGSSSISQLSQSLLNQQGRGLSKTHAHAHAHAELRQRAETLKQLLSKK
jgi:hypothetical protein